MDIETEEINKQISLQIPADNDFETEAFHEYNLPLGAKPEVTSFDYNDDNLDDSTNIGIAEISLQFTFICLVVTGI